MRTDCDDFYVTKLALERQLVGCAFEGFDDAVCDGLGLPDKTEARDDRAS
jgi:hypothetical protein